MTNNVTSTLTTVTAGGLGNASNAGLGIDENESGKKQRFFQMGTQDTTGLLSNLRQCQQQTAATTTLDGSSGHNTQAFLFRPPPAQYGKDEKQVFFSALNSATNKTVTNA